MEQKYLFDTNVLLKNPALLRDYYSNVVISPTVLNELDYRKRFAEHQENAQLSIKHINEHRILVLDIVKGSNKSNNDMKIISEVKESSFASKLIIVSDDEGLQVLARSSGILCINLASFQKEMMHSMDVPTEDDKHLFTLVKKEQFKTAEVFLQTHQINPNFIGEDNLTPLIHFIRMRNFDKMSFWTSIPGCDLNRYDSGKFPMTPYMHAAQRGWLKGMQYILEKGANPHLLSRGKNKGNSALLIAVWDGRFEIVKYLIEKNSLQISINQADGNGFTPLMKAAIKGHNEIAAYILKQQGIDILIRDRDGKTAEEHAQEKQHSEILKMIKGYLGK